MSSLRIALVAEKRSDYLRLGYSEDDCAALPHDGEVEAVLTALQDGLGHNVTLILGIHELIQQLAVGNHKNWDLVFNMSQGFYGTSREFQVPALLEAYQIPFTFANASTMALCQDKTSTKIILSQNKIPTAPFYAISPGDSSTNLPKLNHYPLFVKLATEGSSKGVDCGNKVKNANELETVVQRLKSRFADQTIIVEQFLPGREFTVSILGSGPHSRVIGVREHIWQTVDSGDNKPHATGELDYSCRESKSSSGGKYRLVVRDYDFHEIADPQIRSACLVALEAWRTMHCYDAGRVDLRFDSDEPDSIPNVLELNPISGLLPDHSPLPTCAKKNGISFEKLLSEIVESAAQRTATQELTFGVSRF